MFTYPIKSPEIGPVEGPSKLAVEFLSDFRNTAFTNRIRIRSGRVANLPVLQPLLDYADDYFLAEQESALPDGANYEHVGLARQQFIDTVSYIGLVSLKHRDESDRPFINRLQEEEIEVEVVNQLHRDFLSLAFIFADDPKTASPSKIWEASRPQLFSPKDVIDILNEHKPSTKGLARKQFSHNPYTVLSAESWKSTKKNHTKSPVIKPEETPIDFLGKKLISFVESVTPPDETAEKLELLKTQKLAIYEAGLHEKFEARTVNFALIKCPHDPIAFLKKIEKLAGSIVCADPRIPLIQAIDQATAQLWKS